MGSINYYQEYTENEVTIFKEKSNFVSSEKSISKIIINNQSRNIDLTGVDSIGTILISANGVYNLKFTISGVETVLQCAGEVKFNPTATFLSTLDSLVVEEANMVDVTLNILILGKD